MAFLNEQGVERLWTHIIAKLGSKVDKVDGKVLSTNDYTDEDKDKLTEVAEAIDELSELVGNGGGSTSGELITVDDIDTICGTTIQYATNQNGEF